MSTIVHTTYGIIALKSIVYHEYVVEMEITQQKQPWYESWLDMIQNKPPTQIYHHHIVGEPR